MHSNFIKEKTKLVIIFCANESSLKQYYILIYSLDEFSGCASLCPINISLLGKTHFTQHYNTHTHINQPQKPSYNTHFAITFLRDKHGLQKSLFEEVMINIRRTV